MSTYELLMDLLGQMGWTYAYITTFKSGGSLGDSYTTYYLAPMVMASDAASVEEMLNALVRTFGARNYIYEIKDTFGMFGGVGAPKIEITLPRKSHRYPGNY